MSSTGKTHDPGTALASLGIMVLIMFPLLVAGVFFTLTGISSVLGVSAPVAVGIWLGGILLQATCGAAIKGLTK